MEPDGWIFLRRGRCSLMLGQCPDAIPPGDLGDHQYFAHLVLDDVNALHVENHGHGPQDRAAGRQAVGMSEMPVQTPDGHRVMFSQDLD
ncbi:MAG: bleomycin resistance family protein [Rhodospirillales bacterium]|nr:bleomycin resistance family protein [Rhodospirillales bacterium]